MAQCFLRHDKRTAGRQRFHQPNPTNIHQTQENYDYLALYEQWRSSHLRLRCQSILSSLVIHSNSNVHSARILTWCWVTSTSSRSATFSTDSSPADAMPLLSRHCNGCWITSTANTTSFLCTISNALVATLAHQTFLRTLPVDVRSKTKLFIPVQMIHHLIDRYKRLRTEHFLRRSFPGSYAFVGMGQHSLTNLYPILQYLGVRLKYICVTVRT